MMSLHTPPSYLQLRPDTELPELGQSTPSMVILVSEAPCDEMWRWEVARLLAASGCRYLLAWGEDCQAWHDAVDDAVDEATGYEEPSDEQRLISTWHDDEDLDEVFWFARHRASHPARLSRTLIVHIAQRGAPDALLAKWHDA